MITANVINKLLQIIDIIGKFITKNIPNTNKR